MQLEQCIVHSLCEPGIIISLVLTFVFSISFISFAGDRKGMAAAAAQKCWICNPGGMCCISQQLSRLCRFLSSYEIILVNYLICVLVLDGAEARKKWILKTLTKCTIYREANGKPSLVVTPIEHVQHMREMLKLDVCVPHYHFAYRQLPICRRHAIWSNHVVCCYFRAGEYECSECGCSLVWFQRE